MNNLHPYQVDIVKEVVQKGRCALFLEMGLGKTAIMLSAINELSNQNPSLRFLIIAPKELAILTWPAEIMKFTPHLKYITDFNRSTAKVRDEVYCTSPQHQICILSYTLVRWFFSTGYYINYNVLIIDESTKFKGYRNKTFAIIKQSLSNFQHRYIMTGTPIPNGYLDYYNQIYLVDEGERLGKNFFRYRERYFMKLPFNFYKYELLPGSEEKIQQLTKDIVVSRNSADLSLNLPEFISTVQFRNMPLTCIQEYKRFKKDFVLTLRDKPPTLSGLDSPIPSNMIVAKTQADLTNKLLQYCSGAIYLENSQEYRVIHDIKLLMLEELLDSHDGRIILAYNYQHESERIMQRFSSQIVKYDGNPDTIKSWEAGNTNRVLMSHPKSIGYGLNLQGSSHILIWFGFTWNLELYQQFNKRLHRQGQRHTVYCFHLAVGDIEYKLMERLKSKDITQQALLNYMQTCGLEPTTDGFLC